MACLKIPAVGRKSQTWLESKSLDTLSEYINVRTRESQPILDKHEHLPYKWHVVFRLYICSVLQNMRVKIDPLELFSFQM